MGGGMGEGAMLLDKSTSVLQGDVQWEVYGNVRINEQNMMHDQVTTKSVAKRVDGWVYREGVDRMGVHKLAGLYWMVSSRF